MNSPAYHLEELAIAHAPGATGHLLPANVPDRGRILDIGCGAGQTLIALGSGSGRTTVGIDVDPEALRLGQTLTRATRFVCGKAESLPFGGESFDFAIARVALPYTDLPRAVAEIARVLRAGAMCWFVLHPISHSWRQLLAHVSRLQLKGTVYQLYVLANGVALHLVGRQFHFPLRHGRIESFQTGRGIRRVLGTAGFVDVELQRGHFFTVTARKASLHPD